MAHSPHRGPPVARILIPEGDPTGPQWFLGGARLVEEQPVVVEGFKIYVCVDYLDEPNSPFHAITRESPGSSATLFTWEWSDVVPGEFVSQYHPQGSILFMGSDSFLRLCARTRVFKIDGASWLGVAQTWREVATFAHLDVIPVVNRSALMKIAELRQRFSRLYSFDTAPPTLQSLFDEMVRLLVLFGFPATAGTFCFGALRESLAAAHRRFFPRLPLSAPALTTPFAFHQLRHVEDFVLKSLAALQIPSLGVFRESIGQAGAVVINEAVVSAILLRALASSDSGKEGLRLGSLGIDMRSAGGQRADERFGEVESFGCDGGAAAIAAGLSSVISSLPTPSGAVAAVERRIIESMRTEIDLQATTETKTTDLRRTLGEARGALRSLREAASTARDRFARLADDVERHAQANRDVRSGLAALHSSVTRERTRANLLVIAFVVLFALLILG